MSINCGSRLILIIYFPWFCIIIKINLCIVQVCKKRNELPTKMYSWNRVCISNPFQDNLNKYLDTMSLTILSQLLGVLDGSHQLIKQSAYIFAM